MIVSTSLLLLCTLLSILYHEGCNGLVMPAQNLCTRSSRHSTATQQTSSLHLLGDRVSSAQQENDSVPDIDYEQVFVLCFPIVTVASAFATYDETAKSFHDFVHLASSGGGTSDFPDGVEDTLVSLLQPALTGPISGVISILFGTLVATTISKLLDRFESAVTEVADILDDLQLLSLHTNFFPSKYKKPMKDLIDQFQTNFKLGCLEPSTIDEERIRLNDENQLILGNMMTQLHELNQDNSIEKNDRAMGEAYDRLNDVIKRRSNLANLLYGACFSPWHYATICILGVGICVIFLVLTDKTELLLLGDFQLRMCWAILLGCFSMLATTIIDLNTPLTGGYKIGMETHLIDEQVGYLDDE